MKKAKTKLTSEGLIPVLITTDKDKRGVFFGYIDPKDILKDKLRAEQVQICIYWSKDVHGVLGLAANGPSKNCRISPPVKAGIIDGITFIAEVSNKAVKAWKSEPWS